MVASSNLRLHTLRYRPCLVPTYGVGLVFGPFAATCVCVCADGFVLFFSLRSVRYNVAIAFLPIPGLSLSLLSACRVDGVLPGTGALGRCPLVEMSQMAPLHPEVRPELKRITFFFLINVTDEAWYAACIRMSLRHTTTTRFILLNFLNHTLSKKKNLLTSWQQATALREERGTIYLEQGFGRSLWG